MSQDFIIALIGLAACFTLAAMQCDHHRARIRSALEAAGARDVEVQHRLFAFGRDHIEFDVVYTDATGHRHEAGCLISHGLFSGDGALEWRI